MSSELMIEMKNVHKWFGELHVLNDINLEINNCLLYTSDAADD